MPRAHSRRLYHVLFASQKPCHVIQQGSGGWAGEKSGNRGACSRLQNGSLTSRWATAATWAACCRCRAAGAATRQGCCYRSPLLHRQGSSEPSDSPFNRSDAIRLHSVNVLNFLSTVFISNFMHMRDKTVCGFWAEMRLSGVGRLNVP